MIKPASLGSASRRLSTDRAVRDLQAAVHRLLRDVGNENVNDACPIPSTSFTVLAMLLTTHILTGSLGLAVGISALLARKGSGLHKCAGSLFVVSMILMSLSAIPLAISADKTTSLMGAVLTLYLVITSWLTIRRPVKTPDWVTAIAASAGLATSIVFFSLGLDGLGGETGRVDGLRPEPMFVFGSVALLATVGDLRWFFLAAAPQARRVARHLWRMCFALLMAVVSFFLGQAQLLPDALRDSPLPAAIPVAVLILMIYWLVRIKFGVSARIGKP